MKFLKKESGKIDFDILKVVLLFCFLVCIVGVFIFTLQSERKPKKVNLDLSGIAQSTLKNEITAPVIKTELLAPEKEYIENTPPVAQFIATTPVYIGEQVVYEDQSYDKDLGGSIVNIHWEGKKDFFTKAGTYTVTLAVQDDQGAWSEPVSHVIHVLEPEKEKYNMPPVALFKATNPVFVGEEIVYEDASYDPNGDEIIDREWTGKETSFNRAGKYQVTLRVKDSQGKWSDPLYQYIEVKERPVVEQQRKPIALFTVTTPVYVGQTVTYTDKSFDQDSGDYIVKWDWSASKQSTYNKVGKYDVTLRVQDNHGMWSEPFTKTVEVIDSPNNAPVANFEVNPNPVYVNQPVEFKNTSYDNDGIVAKEQWGGDKKYMYTKAGTYEVTLTVWDDRGASSSITKKITVLDANNQKPVAKFHTNSPVQEGETVYFWDDSYDLDGAITKVDWSGDKRDSYEKAGIYEVKITVWDDLGESTSFTDKIVVSAKENKKPVAQIRGKVNIKLHESVTFTDDSYDPDGYIVSNNWGASSITKSWDKVGVYYIDLEVKDNRGAITRTEVAVYVSE